MEFRILGPLEVREGGRVVPLGGAKQKGVLAILLTRAGEVVSRDRLIDELWGGEPPSSAVSVLQTYVSHLRKALGSGALQTKATGYSIDVEDHVLDLALFERILDEARDAPVEQAAGLLRDALALWRGPALVDFAYEPFAQAEIARLEELRLVALERRIEADLALGREAELIGELETLVAKHPLRERLRGLLILALYRAGRQAEALDAYQAARRALVDELGIEPGRELQALERAILRHDRALDRPGERERPAQGAEEDEPLPVPDRSILVVPGEERNLEALVELAQALARQPPRELILARLLASPQAVATATAALGERQEVLRAAGISCRFAAFTSSEPGQDIVLIASEQANDLVLLDAPGALLDDGAIDDDLRIVLAETPCDVALLVVRDETRVDAALPVIVPFTGAEHDWAAIEIAAWMSRSLRAPLRLVGTTADPSSGRRDASRLLARASLMVQQVVGIPTEPLFVEPGDDALLDVTDAASLLVLGLSPRWRQEGLGEVRLAVVRRARPPVLLVRRGPRPGGLAPRQSMTRFTWTLSSERS
jgi:DNA-binding SARP family transcriptional activator